MGDRTWTTLRFHERDKAKFEQIWGDRLGLADEDPIDSIYEIFLEEVNYGGYEYAEEMWNQKLVFKYVHGSGGDYNAAMIVGFFDEQAEVTVSEGGDIVVTAMRKSENSDEAVITPTSLEAVSHFFKIERLVEKYFSNCKDPEFIAEIVKRKMKN